MILTPQARFARALFPLLGAAALVACEKPEDTTYEADATDQGGGDLIVTEETPAVDVDLPETPMTPVPAEDASAPAE